MTTHNIEIEGLPEGYKAIAITPIGNIDSSCSMSSILHLEKIPPRRIVLEETEEDNEMDGKFYKDQGFMQGKVLVVSQPKIWREVKEGE